MSKNINLRGTFDSDAELYHSIRPKYPPALFEKLIAITQLPQNARLLEIGPGTGQATEPFVSRGYEVTAVELGSELANVAKKVLANYPNVKIITGAFEDIDLPNNYFDLVFAATAFHWIKPEIRFAKPHQLLRDSGHLAIIHTEHVSDENGNEFFFASQPIYKKYTPNVKDDFRLPRKDDVRPPAIDQNLFSTIQFEKFPVMTKYTANEYVQLLSTFSDVISLPPGKRQGFLTDIADVINTKFGGSIEKHVAMLLTIAKKRS